MALAMADLTSRELEDSVRAWSCFRWARWSSTVRTFR